MHINILCLPICLFILLHSGLCNIHPNISGNANNLLAKRFNVSQKIIEEVDENNDEDEGFINIIVHKACIDWLYAVPAAILVGSIGILPLLIFHNCPSGEKLNESISPGNLRLLLSFSVGGLFGDVFLHLLPEAWMDLDLTDHFAPIRMGLWILAGFICFSVIENIFSIHEELSEMEDEGGNESENEVTLIAYEVFPNKEQNGVIKRKNVEFDKNNTYDKERNPKTASDSIQGKMIIGYLNLLANCIDNFTHGLAVGGSFIVSTPIGVCTTFAILLHEIPHEIGDFAILLKAGFSKWEAAKGQLITASGALIGCLFGLIVDSAGDSSIWVLPFTSGGFIYIACVTILPDLLKGSNFIQSAKQMLFIFAGIGTMAVVSLIH